MGQNAAIFAKIQVQYKYGQGDLYYGLIHFTKKYNCGRFCACAMANIMQKKPKRKHGAFAPSSHSKIIVMYNFANKVAE